MKAAVLLALAGGAVGVPVALAGGQPIRANLDADRAEELVIPQSTGTNGAGRSRIAVVDVCNARTKVYAVSPYYDQVEQLTVVDVDAKAAQKEVMFGLFNNNGAGMFKLLKMIPPKKPAGACARPVTLWSYATTKPTWRPPQAGMVLSSANLDVKELSRKYRGKEVRLTEAWSRGSRTAPASRWRYSFYRLQASTSTYVLYGTSDITR